MDLTINPELRDELPPLVGTELQKLEQSIKRDGVLDSVKYWWNDDTQVYEIVDGHHRKMIADKLGVEYPVHELVFESITEAKLWQNMTQTGRRKYNALDRLVELETELRIERTGTKPKVGDVVQSVAEQANVGVATVYRSMAKAKMGYEARGPVGDELDQSLPEENFIDGFTNDEFNQDEPTSEQKAAVKDASPYRRGKSRSQSMDSQRRSALRAYSLLLGKLDNLRLDLLFDNSLELPDFKNLFVSIDKAQAKLPAKKSRFGN